MIVFWLMLQFSRTLRVLRATADAPVGQVASAVMLHSRLREGMALADVLALTRSLGVQAAVDADADEAWRWNDAGGAGVVVLLREGRVRRWRLERPPGE